MAPSAFFGRVANGISNFVAGTVEDPETEQFRSDLNGYASLGKLGAVVTMVVTVALSIFALRTGGWTLFLMAIPLVFMGLLSRDVWTASEELIQVASEPRNFTWIDLEEEEALPHIKQVLDRIFENTLLLKAGFQLLRPLGPLSRGPSVRRLG